MNSRLGKCAWTVSAVGLLFTATWAPAAETTRSNQPSDAATLSQRIDALIDRQLAAEKIAASPRASDAEFIRRIYLDITGAIPPADKVKAFLASRAPEKRAHVIDELLASPQYGRHMADIWQALLFPRTSDTRKFSVDPLAQWLEKRFDSDQGWNQLVSDLLTASGTMEENGAVTFFFANPTPEQLTDQTCRLFLGVQLQCAQCHNHPFTHWKQTEYWGMATFFTKLKKTANPKQAAKKGIAAAISEEGKGRGKGFPLPVSALHVPAKFFQGEQPTLSSSEPYRPVLSRWLTAADNPFFARAMVNRMWGQFFGRGFVNPVDNMLSNANPPSHPELLQQLADNFAGHNFDLKYLVRAICNSNAYQRTSKPYAGNEKDTALFSHMTVKPLSPEQLYDSLKEVLGENTRPISVAGKGKGKQAKTQQAKTQQAQAKATKKGNRNRNPRAAFIAFFETDVGADPIEYQAGIPQALRLMNAGEFNTTNAAALGQAMRLGSGPGQIINELHLATLSRHPTAAETQRLMTFVKQSPTPQKAYSDIVWALLNSSEFAFNH